MCEGNHYVIPEIDVTASDLESEAITQLAAKNEAELTEVLASSFGIFSAQSLCHGLAVRSGWWSDPATGQFKDRNDGEMIALMHSELSEALEGLRKDSMDDHLPHRKQVEMELADTLIRIFDFAGARKLDLAGAVIEKLAYNQRRADHKLENRAQEGGKKF